MSDLVSSMIRCLGRGGDGSAELADLAQRASLPIGPPDWAALRLVPLAPKRASCWCIAGRRAISGSHHGTLPPNVESGADAAAVPSRLPPPLRHVACRPAPARRRCTGALSRGKSPATAGPAGLPSLGVEQSWTPYPAQYSSKYAVSIPVTLGVTSYLLPVIYNLHYIGSQYLNITGYVLYILLL